MSKVMIPVYRAAEHEWATRAACTAHDPELFYPDGPSARAQIAAAKAVCGGCPVRAECLEWTLRVEGAAATEAERARLARRRYRAALNARRAAS